MPCRGVVCALIFSSLAQAASTRPAWAPAFRAASPEMVVAVQKLIQTEPGQELLREIPSFQRVREFDPDSDLHRRVLGAVLHAPDFIELYHQELRASLNRSERSRASLRGIVRRLIYHYRQVHPQVQKAVESRQQEILQGDLDSGALLDFMQELEPFSLYNSPPPASKPNLNRSHLDRLYQEALAVARQLNPAFSPEAAETGRTLEQARRTIGSFQGIAMGSDDYIRDWEEAAYDLLGLVKGTQDETAHQFIVSGIFYDSDQDPAVFHPLAWLPILEKIAAATPYDSVRKSILKGLIQEMFKNPRGVYLDHARKSERTFDEEVLESFAITARASGLEDFAAGLLRAEKEDSQDSEYKDFLEIYIQRLYQPQAPKADPVPKPHIPQPQPTLHQFDAPILAFIVFFLAVFLAFSSV